MVPFTTEVPLQFNVSTDDASFDSPTTALTFFLVGP
jgi:hypothetical protein